MKREQKAVDVPKLYDLTTLQSNANRLFSYTAKQTDLVQALYEKKLCTYPRMDSQFLTADMEATARRMVELVTAKLDFAKNLQLTPNIGRIINNAKVSDHHPIIECGGHSFTAKGKSILPGGWKAIENRFMRVFKFQKDDAALPQFGEGQTFDNVAAAVTEHFTSPPKPYTEDTRLSAMETAGNEGFDEDNEARGLGTPATRAAIIEKLVSSSFAERKKKQLLPTQDGINLITLVPEVIKSPKLTAEWETQLTQIAKGMLAPDTFMLGIEVLTSGLVKQYHSISEDDKKRFQSDKEVIGLCPRCGGSVHEGK